jgi:pyrroline-5-carboxylate reductase
MKNKSLGFIGGGRITRIFLQASKNKSVNLDNITVYEPDAGNMDRLLDLYPEIKAAGSPEMQHSRKWSSWQYTLP